MIKLQVNNYKGLKKLKVCKSYRVTLKVTTKIEFISCEAGSMRIIQGKKTSKLCNPIDEGNIHFRVGNKFSFKIEPTLLDCMICCHRNIRNIYL